MFTKVEDAEKVITESATQITESIIHQETNVGIPVFQDEVINEISFSGWCPYRHRFMTNYLHQISMKNFNLDFLLMLKRMLQSY